MTQLAASPAAAWTRVALQVNPYEYIVRHGHACSQKSEKDYNDAVVAALSSEAVGLIAITDHFRYSGSLSLAAAAEAAGICVLPAFEACTSEGVHLLVLIVDGTSAAKVQEMIWACELHDAEATSPVSQLSGSALLQKLDSAGAVCVAAHATQPNGVLAHLSGTSRALIWTSLGLRAAAIPGSVADVPEGMRRILLNEDAAHQRDRIAAVINAGDISAPGHVAQPGSTCWMRMTDRTLAGVKQAFMDPESRIRLASDPSPDARPVIRAVHWDGGFLDGQTLVLSDELNVLVGAPGAGKSTVIESLRAAFLQETHSDRAQQDYEGLCSAALADTTISVVVEHPHPAPTTLVIQRTMPHPPVVVRADTWTISDRTVGDLVPSPEIYGQHEVADLARDRARRTKLLERFVASGGAGAKELDGFASKLAAIDQQIASDEAEVDELEAQVALLPGKEEELAKWEDQGIAEQLAEETLFQREHRLIEQVETRLGQLETQLAGLTTALPKPLAMDDDVSESPFMSQLEKATEELSSGLDDTNAALSSAREKLAARSGNVAIIRAEWKIRRGDAEDRLAETRRQLGTPELASGFKTLQNDVDVLRGLAKELPDARATLATKAAERTALLHAQEQARAARANALRKAASSVSSRLGGRVRVTVHGGEDFEAFDSFVREHLKGYRKQTTELLKADPQFSFRGLAEAAAQGEGELKARWSMTDNQARILAQLDGPQRRELDRLGSVLATEIELNVAVGGAERWRRLEDLSKGQKATAVLLLLLLHSEAPLVVDQPEDDLDNRFIVGDVVPALRRSKRRRQFIVTTHNANVPVLADADLVAGLTAEGDAADHGTSEFRPEHLGSIDRESVRDLIESQLEGGHDAFEERARRYGYSEPRRPSSS
jgi:ABC-type cobalamin/Fe3+-siderophores transport system ATPase subunit